MLFKIVCPKAEKQHQDTICDEIDTSCCQNSDKAPNRCPKGDHLLQIDQIIMLHVVRFTQSGTTEWWFMYPISRPWDFI